MMGFGTMAMKYVTVGEGALAMLARSLGTVTLPLVLARSLGPRALQVTLSRQRRQRLPGRFLARG